MIKRAVFSLFLFLVFQLGYSQVYSNKIVGEKNEALLDSIEKAPYPYLLPIWGEKTVAKGFQLPYPAGISINYLWQESSLLINNLQVGFNNGEMHSLDQLIRFNDATAAGNAVNIRPDFWLFPFLNVYGIIAFAKTSTSIDADLWLPTIDSAWKPVTDFSTKANFNASSLGFGMTPTFGVAGFWVALDMNFAWTDVDALDKPIFTFIFGPRLGKTFKFKNPNMNIAGWVGGFRLNYTTETNGSLNLSELFPLDQIQAKVDQGFIKVEETYQEVDNWWNNLTPIEKKNPKNMAKYDAASKAIEKASNVLTAADNALNDGKSATIQYSLDKNIKDKWNFVIGTQFQISRHLMFRAEYGFLSSRQQFIGGLQYRFGL